MKIPLDQIRYNVNNGGEIWFDYEMKTYKISRNHPNITVDMQGYLVLHDNGVEISLKDCDEVI